MKTVFNTENFTVMKNYMKYICAILLLVGTSAHAWGTTITLKVWDHSAGAYTDYGTFEKGDDPGDAPVLYDVYSDSYFYLVAWAPGEQTDIVHPNNSGSDYYSTGYGWNGSNYNGNATTLYAVYYCTAEGQDGSYYWTTKPSVSWYDACTTNSVIVADGETNTSITGNYGTLTSVALEVAQSGTGDITWTSSNTNVATVSGDNDDATVTIVGAGTATITASADADATYCAGEATYSITVNAIAPTLSHNTTGKALAVSNITSTGATLTGGVVTNKGGAAMTQYGFVVGTASSVTYGTAAKKPSFSGDVSLNTAFGSKSITGLTPNTTYYVKATAYNGSQRGHSDYISFTTLQRYTISYDNNGGSGSISDQYKDHGATVATNGGASFSKTGYDLSRWDTKSTGDGTSYALGADYSANANVTLYAVWTAANYTVTLNNQSATSAGTESLSVTYNANTNLTSAITKPTKTGYTFGGYYTGIGGEGDQLIDEDGDVVASVDGFTDASKNWIYANGITLYAKWTANTIALTLSKNGVTGTDGSGSVNYDATSLTSRTDATNSDANYHLVGYYAEAEKTTKVLESNGNFAADNVTGYITDGKWSRTTDPTTLYAKWAMTTYTVTFNMHGHGSVGSQEVESGSKVAEPADPVVEDWRFLGWFVDDGGEIGDDEFDFENTTVTADITIHAKWEAISYSTAYKAWCDPDISITGDIHLTTVNGIAVYATSTTSNLLRIQSNDLAGVNKLEIKYLDADNADAEVAKGSSPFRLCNDGSVNYNVADGSQIDVSASNSCDLSYSISYTPSDYNLKQHFKLQIVMKHNSDVLKTVTKDLYGRSLPEEFVVASKFNGDWYALPNTLEATQEAARAVAGIKITVDYTTTPTKATYAPSSTVYKGEGRYAANSNRYGIRLTDGTNHLQVSTTGNNNKMWLSSSGSANCQDWWLSCTDFSSYYTVTIPSNTGNESKKIGMDGGNIGYYESPTSPSEKIYFLPIEHTLVDNPASVTEWGQKSVILEVDAQGIASAQARIGNGAAETATSFGMTRTSVKNSDSKYNYTVSFTTTDFSTHKGELLYIDWLDGESEVVSTSAVTIPWIIATNSVMGDIDNVQAHWKDWEVHVLPGKTLEADGNSFSAASNTAKIKTLEIYPGATVKVTSGTLNVTNLVMRNGWTRANGKSYDVARLYIQAPVPAEDIAGANLTTSNVYADWYIDYDQYYPVAVPWAVTTANMTYLNSSNSASAGVKLRYYDGASRATNVQEGVGTGANWKEYSPLPSTLDPSKGYAMTARRPTGKAFSIVRMPLTIPSASWTALGEKGEVSETHKDQVAVTAHNSGSTPGYAQGWNLIANPYMAIYQGTLSLTPAEGAATTVNYVNIPDIYFKEYSQLPTATTKLAPASAFLIQAPVTGTVTFGTANRKPSAPSYRKEAEPENVPEQQAYIVLNNEQSEDMMGILVSDQYTAEYEINADLEKLLGDGTSLRTYMRYGDRNMAYVAINKVLAQEWIPVSVRLPQTGEYTFSLHEASVAGELEGVYLIDYTSNEVTNLIENSYTFVAESGTISNRFAINATVGERQTPTAIDVVGVDKTGDGPIKFLYRDKVYIWHNGVIYDATGKKVKGGQK